MLRTAAALYVAEARSLASITGELRRQGFEAEEAATMAPQLLELQRTAAGRMATEEMTFATGFGAWFGRHISSTIARGLGAMEADVFTELRGARERLVGEERVYGPEAPEVLPVSGDVTDRELIDIIGEMTPAPAAQQVAATPAGRQELEVSVQPTELEAEFQIPVIIDGREVGRAVGRHVQEINERRGVGTLEPGSRRRTSEQGVP
jgi:hypothetical protein